MRRNAVFFSFVILCLCLLPVHGCTRVTDTQLPPAPAPQASVTAAISDAPEEFATSFSTFYNGTGLSLTVASPISSQIANQIFTQYKQLSRELNSSDETSAMFALNNSGQTVFTLTDAQAAILAEGLLCSERTEGAFDLTSEPLRSLWDFSGEFLEVPSEEEVSAALSLIDYQKLSLSENILTLAQERMQLNTADYFDGYAAALALDILKELDVASGVLSYGNLSLYFGDEDFVHNVSLTGPDGESVREIASVSVSNIAIAAAHCLEQYQQINGMLCHPFFDKNTGYPSQQGFTSVFVFSSSPTLAQTTAKACYSLTVESGKTLLSNLPSTNALWVMEDGSIVTSDGFSDWISITGD